MSEKLNESVILRYMSFPPARRDVDRSGQQPSQIQINVPARGLAKTLPSRFLVALRVTKR